MDDLSCDLCVIGGGAAGLSVAAGAARLGVSVVLIEQAAMGGECLNSGCVPSKSLRAAAAAAHAAREAAALGIGLPAPVVDFPAVMAHVRRTIAAIAPHDSAERFTALGCRVLRAPARFIGLDRLDAGTARVRFRRAVIATGSAPFVPALPGLAAVPVLTNETIFTLQALPAHLLVLGGGPMGVELAQAFRRLGSRVDLIAPRLLPAEDPELVAVVRAALRRDGVTLHEGRRGAAVEPGPVLVLDDGRRLAGSALLLATGRAPRVAGLGLEAAGVAYSAQGIVVDGGLRSSNRRIFAAGDVVAGAPRLTSAAGAGAGVILRRALFRLPARSHPPERVPRVLLTDPELAWVGLNEAEAKARGHAVRVYRAAFADNDRARADGHPEGLVKLVCARRGQVLGGGVVGRHGGELLAPLVLAVEQGLRLPALAAGMVAYPTLAEAVKRAAASALEPVVFGAGARRLVRWLGKVTP